MDNNTLLFQDKGSGRFKDVKIYPNRIEVLKKGTFGGKHTEIVYLKDITEQDQGPRCFSAQSTVDRLRLQPEQPCEGPGVC